MGSSSAVGASTSTFFHSQFSTVVLRAEKGGASRVGRLVYSSIFSSLCASRYGMTTTKGETGGGPYRYPHHSRDRATAFRQEASVAVRSGRPDTEATKDSPASQPIVTHRGCRFPSCSRSADLELSTRQNRTRQDTVQAAQVQTQKHASACCIGADIR